LTITINYTTNNVRS